MKKPNDIWGELGELPEEEIIHVLTKLFFIYEDQFNKDPDNREAINFFRNLDNSISQTNQCNLNRRVNLELSKTRIRKLAGSLDLKHEYNFLVDWRNVTLNFSMTDMFYLALEVARHKELSGAKISLLVPVNSFDRGEFLQLCAQNRGVQLAAFTEYEEATNWLSTATELKL